MKKNLTLLIIFSALVFFASQVPTIVLASNCVIKSTVILKYGSKGSDVICLQKDLSISPVTGYFGTKTKAAVMTFQTSNGITSDGKVGKTTIVALNGASTTFSIPAVIPTTTETTTEKTTPICPNGNTFANNCASTISTTTGIATQENCPSGMVATTPSTSNNWAACITPPPVQGNCPAGSVETTPVAPMFATCLVAPPVLQGNCPAGYIATPPIAPTFVACIVAPSVQGNYSSNNSAISFSQSNVTLSVGQSTTVTLYGSSTNTYYISSNSNPTIASVSISGSTLNLYGYSYGSSNILVCSSSTSCGTLYINASNSNNNSVISFSQSNVAISVGQSTTVTLYGSPTNTYYISSNSNSTIVSASISSNNTLNLSGLFRGNSNISVCSNSGSTSCSTLYVSVL